MRIKAEIWKKVKEDYEDGMRSKDLSKKYKIKVTAINQRKYREKWERKDNDEKEVKKFSVFSEGYSPVEMLEKSEGNIEVEGKFLKLAKQALIANILGEVATVEEFYDKHGKLKYSKVTKRPPNASAVSQLVNIDERISLLSVNQNDFETDEEKEARYIAYREKVKRDKVKFENRDINRELELLENSNGEDFHIMNFLKERKDD